jgi:predicted acyl esterase
MNTGGNTYDETKGIVANNSIHHGGKFQSKIVLPIVKK